MLSDAEIESRAQQLLKNSKTIGIYPPPIEDMAKYLGFECVVFSTKDKKIKNILGAVVDNEKTIYINSEIPIKEQFFTTAHEIGHIILNGNDKDYTDYRGAETNEKEVEADRFAVALLMPIDVFSYKWKSMEGNFDELSIFFACENHLIYQRAKQLGLL